MKEQNRNLLNTVKFAVCATILMSMCAYSAYAQANTPDKAVAKMMIMGIPGDNADGTIEVVGIDQRASNVGGKPSFSLIITKKIDRATPQLFLSNMEGETLSQVKIV